MADLAGLFLFALLLVVGIGAPPPPAQVSSLRPARSRTRELIGIVVLAAVCASLDLLGAGLALRALLRPLSIDVAIWSLVSALFAIALFALVRWSGPPLASWRSRSVLFAAHVGEEYVFRGYFLWTLAAFFRSGVIALVASSVCAGLLYRPSGARAAIAAVANGVVMSAAVLASGSLVPALAGRVLADAFFTLRRSLGSSVHGAALTRTE
jgi:membrane protease YdiL (CAAX protease family)